MLVETVRTPVSMTEYARAVVRAWSEVGEDVPTETALAVLWAQYMTETGGKACWNWNIGNVKHVKGDGFDHCALNNVWEGVTPAQAKTLIDKGLAKPDPSAEHAKAVGKDRVSVILTKDSPGSWFRAYPSLESAMHHHLEFLAKKRYASAWSHVLAGNPTAFATELKRKGYFTASADAYATAMRPHFDAFVRTLAFEQAIAEVMPPIGALYRAVVAAPSGLNFRRGTNDKAELIGRLEKGTIVHVLAEQPGKKREPASPGPGGWSDIAIGPTRGFATSEWLVRIGEIAGSKGFVEVKLGRERWLVAPLQIAPMEIGKAKEVVAAMGCELPTPELVDAIWAAAAVQVDPAEMIQSHDGRRETMDSAAFHARQVEILERILGGPVASENRLVAGAYKDIVQDGSKVGLYGWNVVDVASFDAATKKRGIGPIATAKARTTGGKRVVQDPYFKHALDWRDYSQGVRPVRRIV